MISHDMIAKNLPKVTPQGYFETICWPSICEIQPLR